MRILKEVREVPEHHRTFTLVTVARCILESAAKPLIAEGTTITRRSDCRPIARPRSGGL
jgi:hypothetical protein